eukprot:7816107-Pyramimonas_sp.AAC.1
MRRCSFKTTLILPAFPRWLRCYSNLYLQRKSPPQQSTRAPTYCSAIHQSASSVPVSRDISVAFSSASSSLHRPPSSVSSSASSSRRRLVRSVPLGEVINAW